MKNRLPEKLTTLRKHFGYSQGDLAKSVGVQVAEYLNWENGKSLPRIFQIKSMADIFHVSVDSLIDNNQEVNLVNLEEIGESVSIPFMSSDKAIQDDQDISVSIMPVEGVIPSSPSNLQANVSSQATTAEIVQQEISEPVNKEVEKEPIKEVVTSEDSSSKKKTSLYILAVVALLALLLAGVLFFLNNGDKKEDLAISHTNRLAEGNDYTIFIKENGKIQTWGDYPHGDLVGGLDFVQVDAYDTNIIGLKKDGTVVANNNYTVSASWKNIISVASGRNHIVALNKDGKVYCTGSATACEVDEWSNIKAIFAGNAITAGITDENRLRIVGDEVAGFDGMKDIKTMAIGSNKIAFVKLDGSVEAYNISDLSRVDTSNLAQIELVTVGNDFVAGVDRSGKVLISTNDETKQQAASDLSNISFITSDDDTFVAIDRSGSIFGFGENDKGQYGAGATVTPTPSAETIVKLDQVQNIVFDQTSSNVQVRWDAVKNANSYEISFSPSLSQTVPKSAGTSVSISSANFVKDQEYIVSITALASDEEKYKPSEPTVVTFKYVPKTVQLNSPENVQALTGLDTWNIVWNEVEHADYYLVSVDDGEAFKTTSLVYEYKDVENFEGGSEHIIKIIAGSDDENKYTESEPTEVRIVYELPRFEIELNYIDVDTHVSLNDSNATRLLLVSAKSYTFAELLAEAVLPVGYELAFPDNNVGIYSNRMIDVSVKAKEKPTPEPTPTPQQQENKEENKEEGNNG